MHHPFQFHAQHLHIFLPLPLVLDRSNTGTFGMNTVRNQKTELDIPEKESVKYGMSMYSGDENYRCENDMYVYVCDLYVILHFLQNESKDQYVSNLF